MMGLGSIIGTGVFVSIGLAAEIAAANVIAAVVIAAGVATCNALSSAQLAASHPVSGGTYEYGYKYLSPWFGFAAGWMFFCAKTASAAAAALGFSGYLLSAVGGQSDGLPYLAVGTAAVVTLVVLAGIQISNRVNIGVVSVTILSLVAFIAAGAGDVDARHLRFPREPSSLLHATALMFVAYTGYARIATLGEEVVEPRRTIPRAIVATLLVSMALYVAVAAVYVGTGAASSRGFSVQSSAVQTAPLEIAARRFSLNVHWLVAIGAMSAMLGVLLNLVLGLSRVLLAMGRRGDMPHLLANVNAAVLVVGLAIGGLAACGSIAIAWSFSAFTVLLYYAVTNLAALRLPQDERLYSTLWAWVGLIACLALAFSIETRVWMAGVGLLAVGFAWRWAIFTCSGLPPR
jgi:APA family basic amino acid/polyamine antiporter